jgi:lipopolysaccharide/colanic/teichoic acid biosynthesis glycosyltransferase
VPYSNALKLPLEWEQLSGGEIMETEDWIESQRQKSRKRLFVRGGIISASSILFIISPLLLALITGIDSKSGGPAWALVVTAPLGLIGLLVGIIYLLIGIVKTARNSF